METPDEKQVVNARDKHKRAVWTNDEKIELIKLRLQRLTFEEISARIDRTKHAARSEYGRIRRGETDVTVSLRDLPELTVSLRDLPELREKLPIRKR